MLEETLQAASNYPHNCRMATYPKLAAEVHRNWIWIWTQAYVPTIGNVLYICISLKLCTPLCNCSHTPVVKSNFKKPLWMDFPYDRWWLPSIYKSSAWPTCTRWNNLCHSATHCGFTMWGENSPEWLFVCCTAIIRLYKPWN